MKIAVLDWNGISKSVMLNLVNKSSPWTKRTELEEWSNRVSSWIYSLYCNHKWDRIVVAMDSAPYWRTEFLEEWYKLNTTYCSYNEQLFAFYDGAYFLIECDDGLNTTAVKVKADVSKKIKQKGVLAELPQGWALPPFTKYKGNRAKRVWNNETPKDTFYAAASGLASRIAPLVKGRVISVAGAEADDIGAVITRMAKEHELLLISGDSDWDQAFLHHPEVTFHCLHNNKMIYQTAEVMAQVKADLRLKIVGGEPGDNIKGCPRLDNKGWSCLAEKGASDVIEAGTTKEVVDMRYLVRNQKVIELKVDNLPQHLITAITAKAKKLTTEEIPDVSWGWEDLGLGKRERERVEINCNTSHLFDKIMNVKAEVDLASLLIGGENG